MIITISGSMQFFKRMEQLAKELTALGHTIFMPMPSNADHSLQVTKQQKTQHIQQHIDYIKSSDALVVANYDKHDIAHYIGPNTFLEMGVAYAFQKPIYLLNPIPDVAFRDEVEGLEPIVLRGNLDGIKEIT